MKAPKEHQISFKVDAEYDAEIKTIAAREELSLADLSRKLHRAGLALYKKAGGMKELRALIEEIPVSPGKISKRGRSHGDGQ